MIPAVNAGLTGVKAFERKVDVAARNVANAGTREFKKARATMEEGPGGGVSARVERSDTPGPLAADPDPAGRAVELSNVDLAEELTGMIEGQRGFEANLKAIQTGDEMLGTLLDLKR